MICRYHDCLHGLARLLFRFRLKLAKRPPVYCGRVCLFLYDLVNFIVSNPVHFVLTLASFHRPNPSTVLAET